MSVPGSATPLKVSGFQDRAEGAVLLAEGLVVRAGSRVLMGPVTLRVGVGERVGILGPSGSGKSQLLDRLMGLTALKAGEGRVERRLPGSLPGSGPEGPGGTTDSGRVRFPVSAVFQTNALFDVLTVRENVAVGGRSATDGGEVERLIRGVGLDAGLDGEKFPSELSGGMQRRVALARALRARPALLVLDEPLAGLDGESRRIVEQSVEGAHRDAAGGMAVLVVTHDYEFAASFCDRMYWIDTAGASLVELEDWPAAGESERVGRILSLLREGGEAAGEGGMEESEGSDRSTQPRGGLEGKRERSGSGGAGSEPASASRSGPARVARRGVVGRVLREQGAQFNDALWAMTDSVREIPGMVAGFLRGPGAGARPVRDFVENWLRACVLAIPYVALLFALVGLLMVFQSERLLSPLGLASRIPEAVTVGIVQGFGPLLLALIMAGRTGSAMAADLGGQRLSRQVEMWTLLGRDPRSVLFAPRGWALVIAFPLLLLLAEFIALGAGWVFYSIVPQSGLTALGFWEGVKNEWTLGPTLGGMARTALDGGVLAVIAYLFGTAPKRGAEDVAEASTRTVVVASLAFLVIEVVWTAFLGTAG